MNEDNQSNEVTGGMVLVATPALIDPNFARTLVYMVKHDEEGAFGLVMNKPTGKKLSEAVASPAFPDELADLPLYFGGPVHTGNLLVAVFEQSKKDLITCKIEMNLEQIGAHLDSESSWVRAFVGCSGWGKGQLEQEMDGEFWKLCPSDPLLFDEKYTAKLWSVYFQGVEEWRNMLPYLPEHPEWN